MPDNTIRGKINYIMIEGRMDSKSIPIMTDEILASIKSAVEGRRIEKPSCNVDEVFNDAVDDISNLFK